MHLKRQQLMACLGLLLIGFGFLIVGSMLAAVLAWVVS